ncbi:MAG: BatD family protein [Fibrobacter sp.]|nr:BatD family protein [Fibrobacter sp.]MDY6369507.1 BatD family protein [Fibrobacter sp.]MDY6390767.1 BatD family protein [Fibrobacter sp.]
MKRFLFILLLGAVSIYAQATDPWAMFDEMQQRMAAMMGGQQSSQGQMQTRGPWDVQVNKNPVETGEEFSFQFIVLQNQIESVQAPPQFSVQNGFILKSMDSSVVKARTRRGAAPATQYEFKLIAPKKAGRKAAGVLSWKINNAEYDIFHLIMDVRKSYDAPAVDVSLTPNKKTVYEGEQLSVTLNIHTYEHFQGELMATNMDLGSDFIAHRADLSNVKLMPLEDNPREASSSDKFAWISPLKTGQVSIPPFQFKYKKIGKPKVVEKKSNKMGVSVSFSSIQQEPEEAEAQTAPISITVLPLPSQNKPKDFTGMVGNYNFKASFDKDSLALGDALTLSIQISGDGKPGTITDPKLPDFSDFRTVPPETDIKKKISNGKVITTKNIRIFLYPKKKGEFEIPEISYNWFNPAKKKYEVKTEGPWKIKVEKGAGVATTYTPSTPSYTPSAKEDIEDLGRDIRYIHLISEVKPVESPLHRSILFWVLLVIPLPLYAIFCAFIRFYRKNSSNAALVRKAKAKKNLKQYTASAKSALQKDDGKAFYAALENGLVGYLSDLSNREFRGMTKNQVQQNLTELGISEENIQKVLQWQEACAFARFAPVTGTAEERSKALQEFEALCDALEVLK